MLLSKTVFGSAYIDHVLGRINVPGLDQLPMLLFSQIVSVLGEEIEFRAFFVGKGMKLFSSRFNQSRGGHICLLCSVRIGC